MNRQADIFQQTRIRAAHLCILCSVGRRRQANIACVQHRGNRMSTFGQRQEAGHLQYHVIKYA